METGFNPKQNLMEIAHGPLDGQWWQSMVTSLKMARKPLKLQKENPAGSVGEREQNK